MTTAAAKRELKTILQKYSRGLSVSSRYGILKAAENYAIAHSLDLPIAFRRDLQRVAQEYLFAYVMHVYGIDIAAPPA